ncbi:retinoic acid-induced protein 3 isoform X1 [Periophthalmus magnuspinnatus]|uniref:retinoic acid-induced protein 3 isoform X1 n=1 Tax=Periophthalmus magnuspinnatus TaxID=409849 RepID=UPI00145B098E|nr:retinoic acid-induced protein 3 isoform X1 [Periophthalmus magnuspinnatus]
MSPQFVFKLLFLVAQMPLMCLSQTNSTSANPAKNKTVTIRGCGTGLDPVYRYLCDRRAAWGIVLETFATSGFLLSVGLLIGLVVWLLCTCTKRQSGNIGGAVVCMSMFLLATAGIFGITFAFIIQLTPQTCPTRLFLFGVLFALAFSCLLARCLALLGFGAARGWGETGVALGLFAVQIIIATQWLIIVLLRDRNPCEYSQEEFVMLLIYVLCLLFISLVMSLKLVCRSCMTHSYSYSGPSNQTGNIQTMLLAFTLVASGCIWVVWITMFTRGNREIEKRPLWDDPVLSIALVCNGWVFLMGHGLSQVAFLCSAEARAKDLPLNFAGWTSPSADVPGLNSLKEGRENGSFETEGDRRGRRTEPALRSPYESEFSMTEIDTERDYSIPRPKTTNYGEPYDEY